MDSSAALGEQGVLFPVGEGGRRGTLQTNRRIFADAARAVDDALAERMVSTQDWRSGYAPFVRELTEAGGRSAEAAVQIAQAGLASMRGQLVFRRGENEVALDGAIGSVAPGRELKTCTVEGGGSRESELVVPYGGRALRGDSLRRQLAEWVAAGIIEPSAQSAIEAVAAHPDWLRLDGVKVAVIGAGAETSPLSVLGAWGVETIAIDLPRSAISERVVATARGGAGRTHLPLARGDGELAERAGVNLIVDLPEVAQWLSVVIDDAPVVLGFYVYADGGLHVQATAGADALASRLIEDGHQVAPAYAGTPTDCYLVPKEVADDSVVRREARGLRRVVFEGPLEKASGGRLYAPAYPELVRGDDGREWGVADGLVRKQGPNYALSKRLQRWRSIVAWSSGQAGSFNVAPPTWTKSVTKNRLLAAGYYGARRVGMEVFAADTMRTLMAALMVHDLHALPDTRSQADTHPEERIGSGAVHGGYWRRPYDLHSTLVYTGLLGLPEAYVPKLR